MQKESVSRRNFLASSIGGATAFQIIRPELVRGAGNEKLKAGLIEQALRPVVIDLMRLHDDLSQTAESYRERSESDAIIRDWINYRDIVEDMLYRQGVERFATAPGELFDPRLHRVSKPVDTADRERDRTIVRVIRPAGIEVLTRIAGLLLAAIAVQLVADAVSAFVRAY